MVEGLMSSLKVALTAVFSETPVAASAGLVSVIVGGVVSGALPVVKLHGLGATPAASAFPLRSCAALVIVAVYWVLAVKLPRCECCRQSRVAHRSGHRCAAHPGNRDRKRA